MKERVLEREGLQCGSECGARSHDHRWRRHRRSATVLKGLLLAAITYSTCFVLMPGVFAGVVQVGFPESGDLHILAIGIDEYKDTAISRLRFAKADAEAVSAAVTRLGRTVHPRVFSRVVLNSEATTDGIESAFRQLIASVTPDDTFVFFFAGMGHKGGAPGSGPAGSPSRPEDDFLLLTHDVRMIPPPQETARRLDGGLSGTALKSRFRQIQARNKLVIVDSCYGALFFGDTVAAAAVEGGGRNAAATAVNLILLGTDGMSYEDPQLSHGSLTSALLDGFAGAADIDRNGTLTAWELQAFLPYRALQQQQRSGAGRVSSSVLGKDFRLGTSGGVQTQDRQPPKLRILSPFLSAGGQLAAGQGPLSIKGQALDNSRLKEVTVNGATVPIGSDGTFVATITVGGAASAVEIVALDRFQNASNLVLTVGERSTSRGGAGKDLGPSRGATPVEPSRSPAPPRRDFAILFATDNYTEWSRLDNPNLDAGDIASRLREVYGFDVKVVPDPDSATVLNTIVEYQQRKFGADDQLFVFFAGHGFYDERWSDGFLVSRNSPAQITTNNFGAFLQHASLFRMIDTIPCKHILLVLDACFGGQMLEVAPVETALSGSGAPFGPDVPQMADFTGAQLLSTFSLLRARQEESTAPVQITPSYPQISDDDFVRRKLRGKTRKLLTSGGREYVPDGRPGHHSPFASRFIEALSSEGLEDRVLTTDEVFALVERVIPEPRRGRFTADSVGDFVFVARGTQKHPEPPPQ